VSPPRLTTRVLDVTDTGHRVELLYDDGENDEVLVCAAHGGRVEPGTGEQALELATRLPDATCWACLAYDDDGDEFEQWHPASTAIDPADYPLLGRIADRGFRAVISFHGIAGDGLLVGGGIDDDVKREVAERLDDASEAVVETVSEGPYAGVHPENFVNWLARDRGGLQLEGSPAVRDREPGPVVATLAELVGERRI